MDGCIPFSKETRLRPDLPVRPAGRHLCSHSVGAERFNLIPDPLRANSREHCRASKSLRTDRQRTLLMAGALHPRQGLHLAAEALAKSCEKTRKSVRVMFAGLPESGSDEYVMNNISRLKGLGV